MQTDKCFAVALYNGVVVTTLGLYRITEISKSEVVQLVGKNGFISAIGHAAVAEIFSEILSTSVPVSRISFVQEVGQMAIALKLNLRPEEGKILSRQEVEVVGYTFRLIERIE